MLATRKRCPKHWSASEEANLRAAAAEIEILADPEIARVAQRLVSKVIEVHKGIVADDNDWKSKVEDVDRERYKLIGLYKSDLGLKDQIRRADS